MPSTTSFPSSKSFLKILTISLLCSICLSKTHIDITDHLSNGSIPLTLRCQSKDDDLGYHKLYPNQPSYTWSFVPSFISKTLFFCHFWFNGKDAVFDVFNQENWGADYCDRYSHSFPWKHISSTCYYQVRDDGFYMSKTNDPWGSGSWSKKHSWGDH